MKNYSKFKSTVIALLVLCVTAILLVACNDLRNKPNAEIFTVKYEALEGGSITGKTSQIVKMGENGTEVTAVASSGYEFVRWSDGKTDTTRLEENVKSNVTVRAEFAKKTYAVEYRAGDGGKISGKAMQGVKYGESGTEVTAVPNIGYEFVKWSDGKTEPTRKEENVSENKTIKAEFKKSTYTVEYRAEEGGSILGNAVQTVKFGESTTAVTAVAKEGYEFVKWSDDKIEAERLDISVKNSKILTAEFTKKVYTVQYSAQTGGVISGETLQKIKHGEDGTSVIAIPDIGYEFVKWSDGVESAQRLDTEIVRELNCLAEFRFLFAGGKGTSTDPFLIENYDEFKRIKQYPNCSYKLVRDLDLENVNHIQLFTSRQDAFNGEFDGDNHIIKNLYVDNEYNYPSLFGIVGVFAKVQNLNIENYRVVAKDYDTSAEQYCVGSLAGLTMGGIISDINVSGKIVGSDLYHDLVAIGGFIGWNCADISRCDVNVDIKINNIDRRYGTSTNYPYAIGSFAGISSDSNISDCNIQAKMDMDDNLNLQKASSAHIGGVIGIYFRETEQIVENYIVNVQSKVDITNNMPEIIGGFMGRIMQNESLSTYILNCSVEGEINSVAGTSGFIHRLYGDVRISDSYSKCNIYVPQGRVAGFIYHAQKASMQGCYYKGNIQSIKGYAYGFSETATLCTLYQCFAEVNMTANFAIGFIYSLGLQSMVEQCYCIGNITMFSEANGFIMGVNSSIISNCYSNVQIDIRSADEGNFAVFCFARAIRNNSLIENCLICCDIVGENDGLQMLVMGSSIDSSLENCHIYQNAHFNPEKIALDEINNADRSWFTFYQDINDMYCLSKILNIGGDEVWVDLEDQVTKLKFQTN